VGLLVEWVSTITYTIGVYVLGKICLPKKGVCPDLKKKFFSIQKMFYIWRVGGFVWIDIPLYGKDKIHNIAIQVNIYNSLLINNSYICNVKPIQ
jgi:hypothetical protein